MKDGGGGAPSASGTGRPRPLAGLVRRDSSEFERGLSFFDAIYAFAITLLIVNLDVPPPEAWASPADLMATGAPRQLAGFALSFVVIAAFWRINVRLVQGIAAMDAATTTANLVAAALVVLVPFTTQGISDPGYADYALPTVVYAVNIALASLAQSAIYEVARHRGLEVAPTTPRRHRARMLDGLTTPAVFLASVPVALLWGAEVAKLCWLSLLVIGPVSGRLARRAGRQAG